MFLDHDVLFFKVKKFFVTYTVYVCTRVFLKPSSYVLIFADVCTRVFLNTGSYVRYICRFTILSKRNWRRRYSQIMQVSTVQMLWPLRGMSLCKRYGLSLYNSVGGLPRKLWRLVNSYRYLKGINTESLFIWKGYAVTEDSCCLLRNW